MLDNLVKTYRNAVFCNTKIFFNHMIIQRRQRKFTPHDLNHIQARSETVLFRANRVITIRGHCTNVTKLKKLWSDLTMQRETHNQIRKNSDAYLERTG